jgi:hypothetical protein
MDKTGHMTIAAHTAGRRNGRQCGVFFWWQCCF